jgi:mannose-6-phosphate isomerase
MTVLYPLKFTPILKDKIWGGNKLNQLLGKSTPSKCAGESWELSDVEDNTSIVANGALKGTSLKTLLQHYQANLVGQKVYDHFGAKFPLLIKYIDAKKDLSVQLHPNDELAKERHQSFGKTEMWYVMQADDNSNLIIDFNQPTTKELYLKHLKNKTLPSILNFETVAKGDTFFIEVGRVHAIGAGVMLAEIQQTSDITYRVYDWDRTDDQGNSRELHNDLAMDAIDFNMPNDFKVDYKTKQNKPTTLVSCPYFTTNIIAINSEFQKQNNHDSFMIYMAVEGNAVFHVDGKTTDLQYGETILIPASLKEFSITSTNARLLEVYI